MTDNPHYVTPEEAQTKWCPIQNPPQVCGGTECMAWRWTSIEIRRRYRTWKLTRSTAINSTTHGYCGMVR